jgi:(1->4)-alpha-D-glucan 1-alpha-D-glucosylmutase
VDPDNRRPVDFTTRTAQLQRPVVGALGFDDPSGWAKFFVSQQLLKLRANLPDLFTRGDYTALSAEGPAASHVVAFLRRTEDAAVLVVVPRLVLKLERERKDEPLWDGTQVSLPVTMQGQRWRNLLDETDRTIAPDDGQLSLTDLFTSLPVAVLVTEEPGESA